MRDLRHVAAELRKSVHPVAAVMIAIALGATLAFSHAVEQFASVQAPTAIVGSVISDQELDPRCLEDPADRSENCVIDRTNHEWNRTFDENGRELGGVARAVQATWAGGFAFVAGHFGSALGWLLVLGLAALLVAGEWRGGTITATMLADPGIGRFLFAKIMAIWAIALALMVATGLLLASAHELFPGRFPTVGAPDLTGLSGAEVAARYGGTDMSTWPMEPLAADAHWSSASFALERLAAAAPVLLAFACVAVVLAAFARRPLIVLLTGVAGVAALAWAGDLGGLSPLATASTPLRFAETPYGVTDRVFWVVPGAPEDIYDTSRPPQEGALPLLLWSLAVLALTLTARVVLSLRDRT